MRVSNTNPIGVFDSGMGGISVLRELVKVLPNEDFIFLGDSINAPYGTKTPEEVLALSENCVEFLFGHGAKAVVIACNTATSVAAEQLREKYTNVPIIGIEPAVKPAVMYRRKSVILVMATPMTLKKEKFAHLADSYHDEASIIPLPCPGLVELIESGCISGSKMDSYLEGLFLPYRDTKIDSVVLGCTHFPFVKDAIQKAFPYEIVIFDGGHGTAMEARRRLISSGLCNSFDRQGQVTFFNSRQTAEEIELSKTLFNM